MQRECLDPLLPASAEHQTNGQAAADGELSAVKSLTGRLGLEHRRPSYTHWLSSLQQHPEFSRFTRNPQVKESQPSTESSGHTISCPPEQNNNEINVKSASGGVTSGLSVPRSTRHRASIAPPLQTVGEAEELEDDEAGVDENEVCRWKAWARGQHSCSSLVERREHVERALSWIRKQVVCLQQWDNSLARTFVSLQASISGLRLDVSRCRHQKMLDEAEADVEENRLSRESWYFPDPEELSKPEALRSIGITDMNWTARRFSMR